MFEKIIIAVLVIILAYFVFYLVEFLKIFTKYAKQILINVDEITERLKKEQQFVDGIIFRTQHAVENIQETVAAIENVIEVGKGIKEFWNDKKKNTSKTKE